MIDDVDAGRAALAYAEDGAAEVARALMAVDGDSDDELEEFKNQHITWFQEASIFQRFTFAANYQTGPPFQVNMYVLTNLLLILLITQEKKIGFISELF